MGYSAGTLLVIAGVAQAYSPRSPVESVNPSVCVSYSRLDGRALYGDAASDPMWIKRAIYYARSR